MINFILGYKIYLIIYRGGNKAIKIHILHIGRVIVDEALSFYKKGENKIAWTGIFRSKKQQISILVSIYLIEHPKGLILIDTGWHINNRTHQIKNLLFQYPVIVRDYVQQKLKV
ncbi:hypothetical protein AXE85_07305 [Gemella sp. oral taxon 928]|uniref:hypothetical protein n=1 Tax=unclassified Gemella TaxID=2624949 RepID=UPI000767F717|nr:MULTISPECIES: hypothetical protein [unclassified Gemella]AME09962.1 hypothetical protein AXE85_07305 [Gemella sp. oral taxon 928]